MLSNLSMDRFTVDNGSMERGREMVFLFGMMGSATKDNGTKIFLKAKESLSIMKTNGMKVIL
jgi:hypothetical protein